MSRSMANSEKTSALARSRRRAALALGVAIVASSTIGCRGMTSESPPIHLQQNMDEQRRLDPQAASDFFADGRAMREPVPGTVAVGSLHGDEHLDRGRIDGSPAATLPPGMDLSRALLLRGRERYEIYCAPCHDSAGTGKGTIVARGMIPPPSLHDPRARAMPVGELFDIVGNGIRNMAGYASQVPVQDRWAIAAYVRALQVSRSASMDQVPAELRATIGQPPSDGDGGGQRP